MKVQRESVESGERRPKKKALAGCPGVESATGHEEGSRPVLGAGVPLYHRQGYRTRRRLEGAVQGPRGGRSRAPRGSPHGAVRHGERRRGGQARPGFESRLRHRLAEDPQASDFTILGSRARRAPLSYREVWGLQPAIRAQTGGCSAAPRDRSPPPASRNGRAWAARAPEAAPRTGHAQPRAHPEGAAAAVARQAGPPGSASPSGPGPPPLPARQSQASADGHRFPALTATSTAGSPMLLGLRPAAAASTSAHLPAVGQRRHQPTGAGTRQWRLGRRVGARGRARSDRRGNVAKARGLR